MADISQSPTLTEEMTQAGAILGTAAYMSPEQAKGQPVDKRADIWAFGCLLYECLTAKRVFPGETIAETLAAVLKSDPDWDALAASTPRKLLDLLARCLQKDSRRRLRDIGDAWLEMEEVLREPSQSSAAVTGPLQETQWRPRVALGLLAGLIFGVLAAGLLFWGLTSSAPQSLMRFVVTLPPNQQLLQTATTSHPLALSPDGTRMVYVAGESGGQPQLFLQALDQFQPRVIPGTEGARDPFFSPDGQWVGFSVSGGTLRKVSVAAGTPVTIWDFPATASGGASWGPDNRIVFAAGGLWQVSADGDTPEQLTIPDTEKGERGHFWPQILPGGNAVLFTIMTREGARLAVLALATGQWRTLERLGEATDARYLSTGHLLFAQSERLFAVPFDLAQLQLSGSPIPVLEDLYMAVAVAPASGGYYSVSDTGSLVYVLGGTEHAERTLVGVDREGQPTLLTEDRESYSHLELSPDGTQVAVEISSQGIADIWIYDLERGTRSRLTATGINTHPVWTPDGKQVAFRVALTGAVYWKPADGSGESQLLVQNVGAGGPTSFSPDGRMMALEENNPTSRFDIRYVTLEGDGTPVTFLETPFRERSPMISPNGRWLAYLSDESGRDEIYVQPFPEPGQKWPISSEGGTEPKWSPDGQELFYRNGDMMMVVAVETESTFSAERPRILFEGSYQRDTGAGHPRYGVSPDGQQFVLVKVGEQATPTQINVVLNWFEELKELVPVNP